MARVLKPALIVLAAVALTVLVAACHYHGTPVGLPDMHFHA